MSESAIRSMVKAISWRITGSSATFAVGYIITGDFTVAGGIAGIQMVTNTFLYWTHERVWNRVSWGRAAKY